MLTLYTHNTTFDKNYKKKWLQTQYLTYSLKTFANSELCKSGHKKNWHLRQVCIELT